MQYLASRHIKRTGEDLLRPDIEIPEGMPSCYLELIRVERWAQLGSLPLGCGWMEHPAYYIRDLEAAMIARDQFDGLVYTNRERNLKWQNGGNNLVKNE